MAKKIPKKLKAKNNEEVKSHVVKEKREVDGSKTTVSEKGSEQYTENTVGALPEGKSTVGLSKGLTVNLGNYESARVNCWISRTVNEDEQTVMDNLVQISEMIDEQLQFEVDELEDLKK